MDRDRRYNLRSIVGKSRRIIEDDIAKKLIYYGITKKADPIPAENLQHLSEEDKVIKIKLEKAIEKEKCAVTNYKKAVDRYIRHVGFTFINRIAALRAMEVRGLITETILRKSEYGGMSLRERSIHEKNHDFTPDQVLEESLKDAFREVTKEIKVLFDLESEYSIIFPSSKALRDIIQLLSDDVTEEDWMQDDVIGWIYQYYNEDARKEYRKSKRKPTADDIPVINQFYTPHWVVRVLTDNTLGRLWLEQKDRYPYLTNNNEKIELVEKRRNIPDKSNETEFKDWLMSSEGKTVDQFCSYIVPLINGNHQRDKKRARELKVLDPACGSGHFLIYAFDVLYRIYLEDEPETPEEEIPNLILENNLFGIDIDLRAVQLAALSVYLKAKSYNPQLKITQLNLVCADSHIAPGEKRKLFLDRFSHIPPLQEIFAKTFEDLNNTNELGSLLKVKEPFEELFNALDDSKTNSYVEEGLGQSILSGKGVSIPQTRFQMNNDQTFSVTKVLTINEMYQELGMFEQEAMDRQDMGSLLFATETEKSIGLLSLLTQDYDVILMNPPYGKMPDETKKYLEKNYPRTKNDLYAAFIEMTIDLCKPTGFVGMLTSRTFMFLKTFQKLREDILWNEGIPELFLDAGFGILDGATVETAAVVLKKSAIKKFQETENRICSFCKLFTFDTEVKENKFQNSLHSYYDGIKNELWFRVIFGDLKQVPGTNYAYWAPSTLRSLFAKYPPLDRDVAQKKSMEKICNVKQGLATADDPRFTRRYWELLPNSVNEERNWVPFSKGEKLIRFFRDIDLVVSWISDGIELKNNQKSFIRNESFYFKKGLTYCYSTPNGFGIRYLPKDCIFGHAGSLISPLIDNEDDLWKLLGFLASNLTFLQKLMINPTRKFEVGHVASLPVSKNYKNSLILGKSAKEAYDILQDYSTGNEISTIFIKPWILQMLNGYDPSERPNTGHLFADEFEWANWDSLKHIRAISGSSQNSLKELSELSIKREEITNKRLDELQNLIDKEVYHIYGISDEDQALVKKELELKKGLARSTVGFNVKNSKENILEHIKRLISYYAKLSIEEDEDGIVPIEQLTDDVKEKFAEDFGTERVNSIELELYDILGKSLKDWFAKDYFEYHLQMYKNRPIYWQLTSSNSKGRARLPGAFSCYLNYHKLNRDTIPKILAHHLKTVIDNAKVEKNRMMKDLEKARIDGDRKKVNQKSKKYEEAANIVEELESFENALNKIHNPPEDKTKLLKNPKWVQEKIKEVRDDGWNPVIDYGVRVNIEPLKEAQLLPRSAYKVK